MTAEVPCADWPPSSGQLPLGGYGHASGAAAWRYSVKFSVVPDSSERLTGVIRRAGSGTSGLSATIAGSSHRVIVRAKTPATVAGDIVRVSTPSRLKTTAIGAT